jgi:50S ribosomal subunit-associated GTPase HflX
MNEINEINSIEILHKFDTQTIENMFSEAKEYAANRRVATLEDAEEMFRLQDVINEDLERARLHFSIPRPERDRLELAEREVEIKENIRKFRNLYTEICQAI